MTNQLAAFERDTDEIAPKAQQPTDAELRALWEAVEVVGAHYVDRRGKWIAGRDDIEVTGATPAAALIALAARVQGEKQ